ncbi:MAG: chromosomal replication initiator DnaA [Pseudomonadota bacterium]
MRQLALDVSAPPTPENNFLRSAANAQAVAQVEDWRNWPGGKLVLIGPPGSGKSHLAMRWAEEVGALVVTGTPGPEMLEAGNLVLEDAFHAAGDRDREEALFHAHNAVLGQGGRLLVTGRTPPRDWGLVLPDLASRLEAAGLARLDPPDEALLTGVLLKLFYDRQIRPKPGLVGYLMRRIDRSFAGAQAIVAALDAAGMEQGRAVGVRLAKRLLEGGQDAAPS